jgi:hypothetical protein
MPRALKIFGWTGHRREATMERNVHGQTKEIIAATTKAEAHRMSGIARSLFERTLHETADPEEVAQAMTAPGTVFWQPRNNMASTGEWFAIPPGAAK